jgi:hypothetical protein
MEEANEFLAGLDTKTVKKIFYNIDLCQLPILSTIQK